jgi:hypothetical protein
MIKIQTEKKDGKELEQEVDEDIKQFDLWFQKSGQNDPLTNSEWAIIKTYLWWKTHQTQS